MATKPPFTEPTLLAGAGNQISLLSTLSHPFFLAFFQCLLLLISLAGTVLRRPTQSILF